MQMLFFFIFLHIQEPMVFCIFCIFFFAFFCICFAFSFLLMSQSMDKFVSRGVANDAAADVDDTPELTDGEGDSEPESSESG
jgi:type IV secretory pathway component VirB8